MVVWLEGDSGARAVFSVFPTGGCVQQAQGFCTDYMFDWGNLWGGRRHRGLFLLKFLKFIYFLFGHAASSLLSVGSLWLQCVGASLLCGLRASRCCGFSSCRAQAAGLMGFGSCSTWAQS